MCAEQNTKENFDLAANLRMQYQEVCKSYHAVDDFRAKLLGILPLASGVGGVTLLVNKTTLSGLVGYIALFGACITLGLAIYEARGAQRCRWLIKLAIRLEKDLGLKCDTGQFWGEPKPFLGFVRHGIASLVVYIAVFGGWLFIAFNSN